MITETLHFENARMAQQVLGNDERNLKTLETELGVRATTREGWIRLAGDVDDVERAKKLFQFLERGHQEGAPTRTRDFAHALHVVKHDGVEALDNLYQSRIQTSGKKLTVTPKTL